MPPPQKIGNQSLNIMMLCMYEFINLAYNLKF